ncbi:hypothetical protein BH11ARM1_BH11ARM1_15990 [soil metagenome]
MKTIKVRYLDTLESERGMNEEAVNTRAASPEELYRELSSRHSLSTASATLQTSVNNERVPLNTPLWQGDLVTFRMPAAN